MLYLVLDVAQAKHRPRSNMAYMSGKCLFGLETPQETLLSYSL